MKSQNHGRDCDFFFAFLPDAMLGWNIADFPDKLAITVLFEEGVSMQNE